MGIKLGGMVGRIVLSQLAERFQPAPFDWEAVDPHSTSGLRKFFGESFEEFQGKRLLDFGCGRGADAVAAALSGADSVVGVDVQAHHIRDARALAERYNVSHKCTFVDAREEPEAYAGLQAGFDIIFTIDAFEHYEDPVFVLGEIDRLLAPGGKVLISFGPPWKHPFGAHLGGWIKIPWIHFVFDEPTVMNVRARYLPDGATCYEAVSGGLNRMTVQSFQKLVSESPFRFVLLDPVAIRPLRSFSRFPALREYVTSIVKAVCVRSAA